MVSLPASDFHIVKSSGPFTMLIILCFVSSLNQYPPGHSSSVFFGDSGALPSVGGVRGLRASGLGPRYFSLHILLTRDKTSVFKREKPYQEIPSTWDICRTSQLGDENNQRKWLVAPGAMQNKIFRFGKCTDPRGDYRDLIINLGISPEAASLV